MNYFAQQRPVDHVLAQPDYTSFPRALENIPSFAQPNIHGSAHFGVGGVLGALGNSALIPWGALSMLLVFLLRNTLADSLDPLFFLHHCNLDRVFWEWQNKDLPTRFHQVGGPITPLDYSGKNVTLDFKINIGKLAPNTTLESLLNTQGNTLCYSYSE
jgi:tyrosinase